MNRYETRPIGPTRAREIEKGLALHASASLSTLLSQIQAESKSRTRRGGYWKTTNAMYPYDDEKIQFTKLNFMGPPAAKNTRKATAKKVGTNNSHSLTRSTLTARKSRSKTWFRSGSINRTLVRT